MNPNVSSPFSVKLLSIFPDFSLNYNIFPDLKFSDLEEWTDAQLYGISLLNGTVNEW